MKIVWVLLFLFFTLYAQSGLTLNEAIAKVKQNNKEISIAKYDEEIKALEHQVALGYNYGNLNITQLALRSNDAGNVFGFKLQSREARFLDFGFDEFLGQMSGLPGNAGQLLATQPSQLNYPEARNHFQTQLEYMLPIYTGGKLEQYGRITGALQHLSTLEREQLTNQKIYEVKKSFYAITLLDTFIYNLQIIEKNINTLEHTVNEMMKEGYAKNIDLLEVQARKADLERMLNQAGANKALVYHFLSFLLDERVNAISGSYEDIPVVSASEADILERNLDVQKAKQGLDITKMNIALQQSAYLPTVGAFAQYGSSDNTFLNDFSQHDAYTVGVQIKWNLFNGGIDKNNVEKARVENLKVAQQVALAQKGIALKVDQLRTEIKSYEYEVNSLKKEVELSRAIYENYLGRYTEKLVSINDVIIKQSEEIAKVLRLKEVQNSRNDKLFELEKIANGEIK
ncbi:MAG: TolC family protein [Sulfurospirillaceae bacterium]|nr:TolC family protein [Sulfurospirillaceae bacterium]